MITAIGISNGAANLTWTALAGQTYRVEFNPHLEGSTWTNVPPDVTATGPSASQIDPSALQTQRFYRVRLVP